MKYFKTTTRDHLTNVSQMFGILSSTGTYTYEGKNKCFTKYVISRRTSRVINQDDWFGCFYRILQAVTRAGDDIFNELIFQRCV